MTNRDQIFDVIIIGAGSIGAPTAYYLSQQGMRVLVVDQYASVGQGSNKRAIGGVRATHSDPAKIRLCLRSLEIFSTWQQIYGDDIEWYEGGYCFVAYRDTEQEILQDLLITQKKYGLNIEWYPSDKLLKLVPDLNPKGLLGGTFSPNDGSISPLLTIHAFYRHAKTLGVEFHFNEKVLGIQTRKGQVSGVLTDKNEYSTKVVVNAAGPWAREIGALCGLDLPIHPDSHEAAITEPVQRFLHPMVVDIRPADGSTNYYFYQHATGQILFCISPNPPIYGFDIQETSAFLPMVTRRMMEIMPRLGNIRVRRTWRGLYPMTPDGFPIVGWMEEPRGMLIAGGMCGQGLMLGPGLAELICRMIYNQTSSEDQEILTYLSPYRQFVGQEKLR